MDFLITAGVLAFVVLIVWGIVKGARGDQYANMTEEEFEIQAQRPSPLRGAISELQKAVDAAHHIEYVEEQQESVEADGAESGGAPNTSPES
jgi:hypothetical protein